MNYITLEEIKKQCIIDPEFTEDDAYLEALGDAAEEKVNEHVGFTLDEICAMVNLEKNYVLNLLK